jgi:hypothetical protein
MAPFIQTANVAVTATGATQIVENTWATIAEAATRGFLRGSVVRVHSYNVQNQSSATVNASWIDDSGAVLAGPFQIPPSTGNWTERASPPGFLFETTRSNTTFIGTDLQLSLSGAAAFQVFCEYSLTFTPGRVGA